MHGSACTHIHECTHAWCHMYTIHKCTHIWLHTYTHTWMYICMIPHVHTHTRMQTCMTLHVHIHNCTHAWLHMYTYTRMHTCMAPHVHTYTKAYMHVVGGNAGGGGDPGNTLIPNEHPVFQPANIYWRQAMWRYEQWATWWECYYIIKKISFMRKNKIEMS